MKPVSPVIPGQEAHEVVLAKDQPQYQPLPVLVFAGEDRPMTSRWVLDDEERAAVTGGADILLTQLTFGHAFQPVSLEVSGGFLES